MLQLKFIIEDLWVQEVPSCVQKLMKLNLSPPINDFEYLIVLIFITKKTFHNSFLRSSHGFIYVSHMSFFFFFSPSTKRSTQTRGLEIFKQNMIVFQKEGIMTVLSTFFPLCSFAHLLSDQYALVNIFLKLFFCSCKRDNVMKVVANHVLAGLSSSLCPLKCLIMLSNPERL